MNNDNFSSPEYWIGQAQKAKESNDNESARVYAEKAFEMEKYNIDVNLFYLKSLVQKLENPSMNKLDTNMTKAKELHTSIKEKLNNGTFTFNENQDNLFRDFLREKYEFGEYVEDFRFRMENDLY